MSNEDLLKAAATWSGDTWAGRIDQSASMLFLHGYITQRQREKITARLTKACEAAAKARGQS